MATAVKINRTIFDSRKAKLVQSVAPAQATRLVGALANGAAIAISAEAFERVDVKEYSDMKVVVKTLGTGQGTSLVDLMPMDSSASQLDTDAAERLTGAAPTQGTVTAGTAAQEYITMDVSAFEYVEVVVTSGAVGGDNTNVDWVDVFLS